MANEEKTAKAEAKTNTPSPTKDDGLVEVHKDGEILRVHPTCVLAHLKAGWSQ